MNTQRFPANNPAPVPKDPNAPLALSLQKFTKRPFLWLHLPYTLRLISRCLRDPRTPTTRKFLFMASTGFLLALVIVPELGVDVAALALPVGGEIFDLVGIPFEGTFDWTFLIVALPVLLKFFPAAVQADHIWELKGRAALQAGQASPGA